ncbi:MAG: nickel-dependent lactate racemase [Chloroflexi bacterium]|nr:nickel-dependent lactate racemase [Chloroflexota bacterium]
MTTTRVTLAYGRTGLKVDLPADRTTVIEPRFLPTVPDEAAALRQAMREPYASASLRQRVPAGATVGIVVCDVTRATPTSRILPVILSEIDHVDPANVTIFIATGTHRANTPAELERMLGPEIARGYRVVNHDAFDLSRHRRLGDTSSGGPIWIDRDFLDRDVKILTGFIEPHLFAGFSGGPKMIAPGLAAIETVHHLHGPKMIADPRAIWGITVGNPMHDAIREIASVVKPDFTLDVTLNKDHGITAVFAGDLFTAHRAGCAFVKDTAMQAVDLPYEVVITTNSGYPLDLNLYQAVKGMSAANQIVADGGTIVAAAECSDGLPEFGSYKDILELGRTPDALLDLIASDGFQMHDQWQVQVQAQIQRRAAILLHTDGLTDEQIARAHLERCEDIASAAERLLDRAGPSARLAVLPQGPQTIPYVAR